MVDFPLWARPSGVPYRVRLRAVQHATYYLTGRGPEPEIAALMKAVVECLGVTTFLDVGANFGYYSWLLPASATNGLDVHLFEPEPENVALIPRTIRRRQPGGLHPVAASSEAGQMKFFRDSQTGHRGSLLRSKWSTGETIVSARRLDDEVDIANLRGAVLVKIDVEGSEADVIKGAEKILEQQPVVIFECFNGPESGSAVDLFRSRQGYRLLDAQTATAPSSTGREDFLPHRPGFQPHNWPKFSSGVVVTRLTDGTSRVVVSIHSNPPPIDLRSGFTRPRNSQRPPAGGENEEKRTHQRQKPPLKERICDGGDAKDLNR